MTDASFLQHLKDASLYPHETQAINLIETHISWVVLTGPYAYKFKKPLNLGFLDFSTLEKRHFYCQEEVRLNQRLAPHIYLGVVAVAMDNNKIKFVDADSTARNITDYAVKMRQFDPLQQLDELLQRNQLKTDHIDQLIRIVSQFHAHIDIADKSSPYGEPENIHAPVDENFAQIRQNLISPEHEELLDHLQHWSDACYGNISPLMHERKTTGFIRECHGDMHLRNMAVVNDQVIIFDCIEFNPNLRWIDTISEIAFLVMDLDDRQQNLLAWRFLNGYLERGGDYSSIALLRYYLVYRAMVRAKVEAIRAQQSDISLQEQKHVIQSFLGYLHLARDYTHPGQAALLITHGFSGSGKTTHTQAVLEHLGAIRLRSDIERKRLFAGSIDKTQAAAIDQGIYNADISRRTYHHLATLARQILEQGYSVIIDAACLKKQQRKVFKQLAESARAPFIILDFSAATDILKTRLRQRQQLAQDASDADIKVLQHQLASHEPLNHNELAHTFRIDTEAPIAIKQICQYVHSLQTRYYS